VIVYHTHIYIIYNTIYIIYQTCQVQRGGAAGGGARQRAGGAGGVGDDIFQRKCARTILPNPFWQMCFRHVLYLLLCWWCLVVLDCSYFHVDMIVI
jgi:hypothetical protein